MRRYFGRKLSIYGLTFFVAVTVNWMIPVHARGPHRVDGRPVDHASRDRRADAEYFERFFGYDVPLWKQYLNFWGPCCRGSDQRVAVPPGHQRDRRPCPTRWGPPSRHPVELVGGQQVRSHRRPQSVAGQHVPAGGLPAHGHPYMWLAWCSPSCWRGSSTCSRWPGVLGHPAAQLVVDLRLGSAPPLVPAVRHVVIVAFGGWAIGMRNMIIYELEADYSRYLESLGARGG